MKRKFYSELIKWKNNDDNMPLMVIGARQIGKTYIIDEFCKNEYKNYIYINLMKKASIVSIFESDNDFDTKLKNFELELGKKIDGNDTILFLDEIQVSEGLISSLKFFSESSIKYNIICAGSLLGVKLHRFKSSFPVGKVKIKYMYPMDFEEFLWALDKKMWADEIKNHFMTLEEILIHDKLIETYRTYLCLGGMPAVINNYIEVGKDILLLDKTIIKDIWNAYLLDMNQYTISNNESIKIEKVYKSIPISLAKENKKFQYADIGPEARRREFESPVDWLKASNLVYQSTLLKRIEIPLKAFEDEESFKLYLNDVGILVSLLDLNFSDIILNKEFMLKGAITENYVAQALKTNDLPLYYWRSKNKAEIDFLIYNTDGIIPIDVKTSDNTQSKSLNLYMEKFNPKYAIRLSTKNFGYSKNIKSVPLYATFCIE